MNAAWTCMLGRDGSIDMVGLYELRSVAFAEMAVTVDVALESVSAGTVVVHDVHLGNAFCRRVRGHVQFPEVDGTAPDEFKEPRERRMDEVPRRDEPPLRRVPADPEVDQTVRTDVYLVVPDHDD